MGESNQKNYLNDDDNRSRFHRYKKKNIRDDECVKKTTQLRLK